MNKTLQALYGLKFNPFSPAVPQHALFATAAIESFCWRMEHQVQEGGFAQVWGDPGTGKSVALRILAHRLAALRDVTVGVLTRPQANVADFYRELGDLFGVTLTPHNRWVGAKALRERWQAHIEASLFRPILLVDEAQEMLPAVLSELRLLSSADLDSRSILTVVLAGDTRLVDKLRMLEMLPVSSRIRCRLHTEYANPRQLHDCLHHLLKQAGNPSLMTTDLMTTLCEHAAGNYRTLANMANDLLHAATQKEIPQLDEQLFFELLNPNPTHGSAIKAPRKTRKRRAGNASN